jgi:hypothetical protein
MPSIIVIVNKSPWLLNQRTEITELEVAKSLNLVRVN